MIDRRQCIKLYFQSRPLLNVLIITNLWQTKSKIWICTEPDHKLFRVKLQISDNLYTTAPQEIFFQKIKKKGKRKTTKSVNVDFWGPKMCLIQAASGFEDDLNTFIENAGDTEWMGVVLKVIRSTEEIRYQHESQSKVTFTTL